MGRNGVGVMQGIGMFDRAEDHYMVIDVDGTVSTARQRSVEKDRSHIPARATAERQSLCAGVQRAKAWGSEPNANDDRSSADKRVVGKLWGQWEWRCERGTGGSLPSDQTLPGTTGVERGSRVSAVGRTVWECKASYTAIHLGWCREVASEIAA
jgi:hypothetical protein